MTDDQYARDQETIRSLLFLIADIRQAVGDVDARLMQDELVARVKSIHDALAMYADRDNWEYGDDWVERSWLQPGAVERENHNGWELAARVLWGKQG